MIYYLDENPSGSWADTVLGYLQYDTNPGKLQSLIRWTYRNATKNIRIKGAKVIAHPLFEDLDPKDTRDYDNRVEPSIQEGRKWVDRFSTQFFKTNRIQRKYIDF